MLPSPVKEEKNATFLSDIARGCHCTRYLSKYPPKEHHGGLYTRRIRHDTLSHVTTYRAEIPACETPHIRSFPALDFNSFPHICWCLAEEVTYARHATAILGSSPAFRAHGNAEIYQIYNSSPAVCSAEIDEV